ncbi:MAG: oligosaccharide flippase family protein [Oscillospiraceae bacterium]|nr:oligosaccharide flippase family protein [Oscillospiraceae bacterium]
MKLDRTSMLYGTLVLTITGIISQILGFVYRIFLSRLIGAENMGLYQLVLPVYGCVLSIVSVGLSVSVSRLSAEYQALGNTRAVRQVLRKSLFYLALLFLLISCVTVLMYDPISVHLLGDARTQMSILLLLPCILLTGIENIHKHYFYGTGQVRPPALVELAEQLVRMFAVLALLVFFLPQNNEVAVGLMVLGMVICELFSALALSFLFRRRLKSGGTCKGDPLPSAALRRSIGKIALPVGINSLIGNLMSSANAVLIPQLLVAAGWSISEAMASFGVLFGMALPMLCLPFAFIGALCTVLVPKLAQSAALGRTEEISQRVSKALLSTSVLVMPVLAILLIVGPTLGQVLFLEPMVGDYLPALSIGVLFSCYQSVLGNALYGIGRQNAATVCSLVCDAVQLAFTYFGTSIPGVGLYGFIAGFVVSSAAGAVFNAVYFMRVTGMRPCYFTWIVSPGLSTILTFLCGRLLFQVLQDRGLAPMPSVLAVLLFGVILYLSALYTQGVRTESGIRP